MGEETYKETREIVQYLQELSKELDLTLSETFKSTNDGMILIWVKNPTEGTYQENEEKFPSPQELSKELDYPFNEAFNRNTNDLDLAGIKETL